MVIKRVVLDEGDELPTHRQNIIHKRVVSDNPSLDEVDPVEAVTEGIDTDSKLEVWYVDKDYENP